MICSVVFHLLVIFCQLFLFNWGSNFFYYTPLDLFYIFCFLFVIKYCRVLCYIFLFKVYFWKHYKTSLFSRALIQHTQWSLISFWSLMLFFFQFVYRGYYPKGGGQVVINTQPLKQLQPITMTEPGQVTKITGMAFVAGVLPFHVITSSPIPICKFS